MIIRKATILDYNTIVSLWESAELPYKAKGRDSRKSVEKEMNKDSAYFLLAEIDAKAIGSVLLTHDGRKGWINRLAVIPEYRNKGIGKALVDEAERILEELGIGIYACLIEDYNKSSLEVFQKMGYKEFPGMHYLTKRKFHDI